LDRDGKVIEKTIETRTINNESYTVTECTVDKQPSSSSLETKMTMERLGKFRKQWDKKWKPTLQTLNTN
jgi:hypothetical protein